MRAKEFNVESPSLIKGIENEERENGFPFFLTTKDFNTLFSPVVASVIGERRISEEAIESERKYLASKYINFSY